MPKRPPQHAPPIMDDTNTKKTKTQHLRKMICSYIDNKYDHELEEQARIQYNMCKLSQIHQEIQHMDEQSLYDILSELEHDEFCTLLLHALTLTEKIWNAAKSRFSQLQLTRDFQLVVLMLMRSNRFPDSFDMDKSDEITWKYQVWEYFVNQLLQMNKEFTPCAPDNKLIAFLHDHPALRPSHCRTVEKWNALLTNILTQQPLSNIPYLHRFISRNKEVMHLHGVKQAMGA